MEGAVSFTKYVKILSGLLPAGATGMSVLLASMAPSAAHEEPAGSTAQTAPVGERLAAIRDAVSTVSGSEAASAQQAERQPMVAWWNGWWAWPNWNNWRNWPNWRNWGNYWNNW
jgi:hypothetical protein